MRCGQLVSRIRRLLIAMYAWGTAGLWSIGLAVFVPVLRAVSKTPEAAELRVQKAIHRMTRLYMRSLDALGGFRIRCDRPEELRRPGLLVVANHPTLFDAWALMSHMPQADCVVGERYYDNFFLGGPARGAGYIPNRDGASLVEECARRLARGRSLIMFPEGTRSPRGALGPFARGAAHIALRAGVEPIPVTLRCVPDTLYHGQPWWDAPEETPVLTISVGDAIPVKGIVEPGTSRGRAARTLTDHLRTYFERQLGSV